MLIKNLRLASSVNVYPPFRVLYFYNNPKTPINQEKIMVFVNLHIIFLKKAKNSLYMLLI